MWRIITGTAGIFKDTASFIMSVAEIILAYTRFNESKQGVILEFFEL